MSRPYRIATTADRHTRAGAYIVPASPVALPRPNRNAAGMQATVNRRGKLPTGDALTLAVRGTFDALASARFDLERAPCDCCGSKGERVRLKPGKPRLRLAMIKKTRPRFFLPR